MITKEMLGAISRRVITNSAGEILIVNLTPHPINFRAPDGTEFVVPTSVPEGKKDGWAVINSASDEVACGTGLVKTVFKSSPVDRATLKEIKKAAKAEMLDETKIRLVGSIIAADTYPDIVGMCPHPDFKRVPPAEKRMDPERFNIGAVPPEWLNK